MNLLLKQKFIKTSILFFLLLINSLIFGQVTIKHMPVGYDNLYEKREVEISTVDIEREPRDPEENEETFIKFSTSPVFTKQECLVEIVKNGKPLAPARAEFRYNQSGESFWKAGIGKYEKGDSISYSIRINADSLSAGSQEYSFKVAGWDYITVVKEVSFENNCLILNCESTNSNINPVISLSFNSETAVKVNLFPYGKNNKIIKGNSCTYSELDNKVSISSTCSVVEVTLKPYSLKITNKDNKPLAYHYPEDKKSSVGLLNDNTIVYKIKESFFSDKNEKFFGFGERYNAINQRGNSIDNYVVNIWKNQDLKTYIPVPFYFTNTGYGFFLNSTYYSRFDLDTENNNKCTVYANCRNSISNPFEYFLFTSDSPSGIISEYTSITGKPGNIEVWSLGPWISANEWDKQSEIDAALDSLRKYDILNTVVVLEAWSDEETFYIFNDAKYKNTTGGEYLKLSDFEFSGRWPDPPGMVESLHKNNMRIVLWNIPVLKFSQVPNKQRDIDEQYAIEQKYVVLNPDGTPNRIPPAWFGHSLSPDFTNKEASDWWMNKRKYLIEELKVDGFKCDGGEFIWGRDLIFCNGMKGDEIRNIYANQYLDTYYNFIKSYNPEGIVFHRAGTFGAQVHPFAWNGDQTSSFPAFREAIRSLINLSISGIPFVAYDIAGYYDEVDLSPSLYKRSVAQAAFSPAMQFHSGYSGDAGLERSPWNIARLFKDPTCIDIYKKYAAIRFNIIPYLYTEAVFTSATGIPLMRPLFIQYPDDLNTSEVELDYMLGNSMIVLPVSEPVTTKKIYLPEGSWYDFWTLNEYKGNEFFNLDVPEDHIPVFIKSGSIVPLNIGKKYQLAEGITNKLNSYENLSFFIFPEDTINYSYNDYTNKTVKTISSISKGKETVLDIPGFDYSVSLVIKVPGFISLTPASGKLNHRNSIDELADSDDSWYYSVEKQLLYIKIKTSEKNRIISVAKK